MGYTAIVDYGVGNLMSATPFPIWDWRARSPVTTGTLNARTPLSYPAWAPFPMPGKSCPALDLTRFYGVRQCASPFWAFAWGCSFSSGRARKSAFVQGSVQKIPTDLKLPHIGWNSLQFSGDSPLFRGIPEEVYVYFVHSFCGVAEREDQVIARTNYGGPVVAAVQNGNVFGTQFHPEKSGEVGLAMLRNFGGLNR